MANVVLDYNLLLIDIVKIYPLSFSREQLVLCFFLKFYLKLENQNVSHVSLPDPKVDVKSLSSEKYKISLILEQK